MEASERKVETAWNLINLLWADYIENACPQAHQVSELFRPDALGTPMDHIAFRSVFDARFQELRRLWTNLGYVQCGEYDGLCGGNVAAVHLENAYEPALPRIFISNWVGQLSGYQESIFWSCNPGRVPEYNDRAEIFYLFLQGRLYVKTPLVTESELRGMDQYLAWCYLFGRRVNHFTLDVNGLDGLVGIEDVVERCRGAGIAMKDEIEGSSQTGLRQTSTKPHEVDVVVGHSGEPSECSIIKWPLSYFEIAERFGDFSGFIGNQADGLFVMTSKKTLNLPKKE